MTDNPHLSVELQEEELSGSLVSLAIELTLERKLERTRKTSAVDCGKQQPSEETMQCMTWPTPFA